jgi:type VI protein secretion system component Hcp
MCTVERMALILLLTMTAGCWPNFLVCAPGDSGASDELIEAIDSINATNGELRSILLRATGPDGSTITAGSSLDSYQDWVDVLSVTQGTQAATGAAGSRPGLSSLNVTKYVDRCTVQFYDCQAKGTRLPKVEIMILSDVSAQMKPVVLFVLEGAHIESISFESHPDDMPSDAMVLIWEKISYSWYKYDEQGQLVGEYTHIY